MQLTITVEIEDAADADAIFDTLVSAAGEVPIIAFRMEDDELALAYEGGEERS